MAISKVVYGSSVLMDLTSDTVDAAHLAKGYTAHDAGGNLIVGALEQQTSENLLSSITPSLLNGATQSGKTYVIPAGGESGTAYIEYKLDIPELKSDTVYNIVAFGQAQGGYRSMAVELVFNKPYYDKPHGDTSSISSSFLFGTSGAAKAGSFSLASGRKPTKLVFKNANDSTTHSLNISNIMLMTLEA